MTNRAKHFKVESKQAEVQLETSGEKPKMQTIGPPLAPQSSASNMAAKVNYDTELKAQAPITSSSIPAPDCASSESTQDPHLLADVSVPNLKLAFDFTTDIIDKQYRSYTWNDGKVQALLTIDTALIAGILLILQIFDHVSVLAFSLLGGSFVSLLISFFICLVHAIPRIHSGIGNEDNLRTMIGISRFNKEEYHTKISRLNLGNMVRMNCWQIAGMCKNNMRSHYLIKRGVYLTIIGVLAIGIALPIIVFSDWNRRNAPIVPQSPMTGSASNVTPTSSPEPRSANQMSIAPSSSATNTKSPSRPLKSKENPK